MEQVLWRWEAGGEHIYHGHDHVCCDQSAQYLDRLYWFEQAGREFCGLRLMFATDKVLEVGHDHCLLQ